MTQETLTWIQTPANAPDNAELEAWKALYAKVVGPRPEGSVCSTPVGA